MSACLLSCFLAADHVPFLSKAPHFLGHADPGVSLEAGYWW